MDLLDSLRDLLVQIENRQDEVGRDNDQWFGLNYAHAELYDLVSLHVKERNRQLAEEVQQKQQVLYVVFANYDYYPSPGLMDAVCVTADWRAAYYSYKTAVAVNSSDKTISMWEVGESKWKQVDMENQNES